MTLKSILQGVAIALLTLAFAFLSLFAIRRR